MSSKGNDRHLKRLAVGAYPKLERKTATYFAKPRAGRHTLETSIALLEILRDKLALASTSKEAKHIVKAGKIEINGRIARDEKYAVGFGDVITLVPTKENYVVGITRKGGIDLQKAKGQEKHRTVKVIGKYLSKGKVIMARLLDGSVVKADAELKVNDSVVIEGSKIKKAIKFENGAKCLVMSGTHASKIGTISEINKGTAVRNATVRIAGVDGQFETLVENVMVVGA